MRQLNADDLVRCIVVRGAGKAFAAGADIAAFEQERSSIEQARTYGKVEEAGNEAHNRRDYSEARKHYQKAVDMAPNNATGWSNLARAYAGLRNTKKMAEAIQKAIR